MPNSPVRIIQISDTHLFSGVDQALLGVKTRDSFHAVLNQLQMESNQFEFIIHSGDISQDQSIDSYQQFAAMLKSINRPVYYTNGNHDDETVISQIYPLESICNDKHIVLHSWQIILLNSQIPRKVPGFLDNTQLDFLKTCLTSYPHHFAMVLFHHHPVAVGCAWLDQLGVTNADVFWEVVSAFPMVKAVFFGHVHQQYEEIKNGIYCYSVPSTCIQFKPKQAEFGLEKNPPGFRRIALFDDGNIETEVVRIKNYIGNFDVNAAGY
jgi:Icc protein